MNWSGFVPELLSTLVGAVFGILVGLPLDRKRRRHAARGRTRQAGSILLAALCEQAARLQTFVETLARTGDIADELLRLQLDVETWETVRPLVGEGLQVDLAAHLARHFAETRWVERAVRLLVGASLSPELARVIEHPSIPHELIKDRGGDLERGLLQAHLRVLSLREELTKRAGGLAKDASQLASELGEKPGGQRLI